MKRYGMMPLMLLINGFITGMGYAALIEQFQQFSILLIVLLFCQLIITSMFIAYGFLYLEVKELLEKYRRQRLQEEVAGRTFQQYTGRVL